MRKIAFMVGLVCLCLVSVAHAYPQDGNYRKGYGKGYGCEKKIARLEEKRQIALKYNRIEQVQGIDRALENTRRYCGKGEYAGNGYGEEDGLRDARGKEKRENWLDDDEQDALKKKLSEMGNGAKEQWKDLKENSQESFADLKDEMDESFESLEETFSDLKDHVKDLEKDLAKAIEKGAESDRVKDIQKKLQKAKKSMQDFLND